MRKFNEKDLKDILIRAQVDGKWGNWSLQELYDMRCFDEIWAWVARQIAWEVGFNESNKVKLEHVVNAVNLLDYLGIKVYKLN